MFRLWSSAPSVTVRLAKYCGALALVSGLVDTRRVLLPAHRIVAAEPSEPKRPVTEDRGWNGREKSANGAVRVAALALSAPLPPPLPERACHRCLLR